MTTRLQKLRAKKAAASEASIAAQAELHNAESRLFRARHSRHTESPVSEEVISKKSDAHADAQTTARNTSQAWRDLTQKIGQKVRSKRAAKRIARREILEAKPLPKLKARVATLKKRKAAKSAAYRTSYDAGRGMTDNTAYEAYDQARDRFYEAREFVAPAQRRQRRINEEAMLRANTPAAKRYRDLKSKKTVSLERYNTARERVDALTHAARDYQWSANPNPETLQQKRAAAAKARAAVDALDPGHSTLQNKVWQRGRRLREVANFRLTPPENYSNPELAENFLKAQGVVPHTLAKQKKLPGFVDSWGKPRHSAEERKEKHGELLRALRMKSASFILSQTAKPQRAEKLIQEGDGWDAFEFDNDEAERLNRRDAQAIQDYAAGFRPACPIITYESAKAGNRITITAFAQDADGEISEVGRLRADKEGPDYVVHWSDVPFLALATCRGLGTNLYQEAANYACDLGYRLAGSAHRSPFSQRFWDRQITNNHAFCGGEDSEDYEDRECEEYEDSTDCAERNRSCLERTDDNDTSRGKCCTEKADDKLDEDGEVLEEGECTDWETACDRFEKGDCIEYAEGNYGDSHAQIYELPTQNLRDDLERGTITVPQYNTLRRGLPGWPRRSIWECGKIPIKRCPAPNLGPRSAAQSSRGTGGLGRARYRIESKPSPKKRTRR